MHVTFVVTTVWTQNKGIQPLLVYVTDRGSLFTGHDIILFVQLKRVSI